MKAHLPFNLTIITLFSFFIVFSQQAFALGKVGHKVICQITFDHLSNNTQNKITLLLKELPKKHQTLINKYNHKKTTARISFADTCTWADAIRKDKSFNQYKKWHYLNVARNQEKVTAQTCQKNCITAAINLHTKALKELSTSWKKLQALMFLGHWLGDIHQPMHVNFASDLGGNRTKIAMKNGNKSGNKKVKCKNMHWLWDECLLYSEHKSNNTQLIERLTTTLTDRWQSAPISKWQQDSVYVWATESLTIARSASVLYCRLEQHNYCQRIKKKTLNLPNNYLHEHKPILEKRMLQAAARLAYALESSL